MKSTLPFLPLLASIALIATISIFSSCGEAKSNPKPKPETPQALEHPTSSSRILSKRGPENLVDNLYEEAAEKNAALKSVEEKIDALKNAEGDSTTGFHTFDQNNTRYFEAANGYMGQIKDSVLRQRIRALINTDLAKYNLSTAEHKRLLNGIDDKNIQLDDLHTALKIVTTLPMMHKYQAENLPSTNSLSAHIKNQDKVIREVDSLAKAN